MPNIVRQRKEGKPLILLNGDPIIICEAKIGALVRFPVLVDRGEGYFEMLFEKYVRSPGCRIIAFKDGKVYLQKEARIEGDKDFDWRLPGGKVIDSFASYKPYLEKELPEEIVLQAAREELQQEAGLDAKTLEVFDKKICGTTVEWDLYYVIATDVEAYKPEEAHAEGEEVQESGWFDFDTVLKMCKTGEIAEGRTALALLQFMHRQS